MSIIYLMFFNILNYHIRMLCLTKRELELNKVKLIP